MPEDVIVHAPVLDSELERASQVMPDLVTMKREIDALQVAAMSQNKRWYENTSTLIAFLALLFSFGTTAVSYFRTRSQDVQASRLELRGILQRLNAIPRENLEATKRYAGDPASLDTAGRLFNQENAMLVRQGGEIARNLPKGLVSATEYYALSVAFQNAYNIGQAKEFLKLAINNAKEFNDEIAAIRSSANLEFVTGQPQAGRVLYEQALNIFQKYPDYDQYTKANTNVQTELSWAYSEASVNQFQLAASHTNNAEQIVNGLPFSPGAESMKAAIAAQRQIIARATTPSTSLPGTLPPTVPQAR